MSFSTITNIGIGIWCVVVGKSIGFIIALIIILVMTAIVVASEFWKKRIINEFHANYVAKKTAEADNGFDENDYELEDESCNELVTSKKYVLCNRVYYFAALISALTMGVAILFCFLIPIFTR
jgi:Na+-transporting methylmalonyl-CoA/oxaloacetate decarboxylase gamma subunit